MNSLHVVDLTKFYEDMLALETVSFEAISGEFIGLLGANGAGKSTLIKCLSGVLAPSSGNVFFNKNSIVSNRTRCQYSIGYLPESPSGYEELTVTEFIKFSAASHGLSGTEYKQAVLLALEDLQLKPLSKSRLADLSKGLRQRVWLAQALVHNPDILFLDEPTSGLDPMGVRMLREVIDALNATGMTIFMNTHLLSEVSRSCTSIGVLSHGKLVFQDSMEAVTARYHTEDALEELYMSVAPEVAA